MVFRQLLSWLEFGGRRRLLLLSKNTIFCGLTFFNSSNCFLRIHLKSFKSGTSVISASNFMGTYWTFKKDPHFYYGVWTWTFYKFKFCRIAFIHLFFFTNSQNRLEIRQPDYLYLLRNRFIFFIFITQSQFLYEKVSNFFL